MNYHRRHLDESQRAMVAAKIANISAHSFKGNQHHLVTANLPSPQISQAQAADMLNISERMIMAQLSGLSHGEKTNSANLQNYGNGQKSSSANLHSATGYI
jgi:hypothetical protein